MMGKKRAIITVSAVVIGIVLVATAIMFRTCWAGPRTGRTELVLYCGAGIRSAAADLIRAFEAEHDVRIAVTYEGSGQSLGKISAGAPGDLFMPGSEFYVDQAIAKGLADGSTKQIVAWFVPVILVRKDANIRIQSLKDLTNPDVRVGLGDERSAAVGQTTMEIFRKNGIDPRSVNVVYKSGTADELGVAVRMGSVDAVIIWDVNARQYLEHGDIVAIPADQNVFSPIPVAVLRASQHVEQARAFIEFACSDKGRHLFAAKGFMISSPVTASGPSE